MAKRFLTLDVGAANVALAEYEIGAKGAPKLLKFGTAALSAPLDGGDAATILVPALLEIVREKGIRPGPVAISVSGQMVFPRFAAIPAAGGDEHFEQQVRFEIEQNVPFPIDEMVCDRQVLGDTPEGDKNVMIVAAKTEQIEEITSAVADAGFRPEIVDVAPLALTNAVRAAAGSEGCDIILDIGAKTTSLVIVEGDRLYNRSIPIAGNTLTREIASALGCTAEEAEEIKVERGYVSLGGVVEDEDEVGDRVSKVCRAVMTRLNAEISRSVNFYRSQQGGGTPQHLYLTGGTALLPQIDQFFGDSLQIEVAFFNPFDFIRLGPGLDADEIGAAGAFLAPTVGLALHVAGAATFAINLLPPSIVSQRAEIARIPAVAIGAILLVAALVLVWLAVGHSKEVVRAQVDAVEGRVGKESEKGSLKYYESCLRKAESDVEKARASADQLKVLLAARAATVARLGAFRQALPAGMWIERWEPGSVVVRGWHDRVEAFVRAAAAKNGGEVRTAPELVVTQLKATPAFAGETLKISNMTSVGKGAPVDQFTVELVQK